MRQRNSFLRNTRLAKKAIALAWPEFLTLFPEQEDCIEYLYKMALEHGFVKCDSCGCTAMRRNYGDRVCYCTRCNQEIWFTSGTLFDHVKNPQAWLGAIWLMEKGLTLTSSAFAEVVGIVVQSSASVMLKKLRLAIASEMTESAVLVPSRSFLELFCKRSLETPARAHPSAEQEELDKQQAARESDASRKGAASGRSSSFANQAPPRADSPGQSFDRELICQSNPDTNRNGGDADARAELAEAESRILSRISEEPLSVEALSEVTQFAIHEISAALTMLELSGSVVRLPGERYRCAATKEPSPAGSSPGITLELKEMFDSAVEALKYRFHGTSRKAIQYYLAEYWCSKDRKRWSNGAVLMACLRFGEIHDEQILDYVSPSLVKFVAKSGHT